MKTNGAEIYNCQLLTTVEVPRRFFCPKLTPFGFVFFFIEGDCVLMELLFPASVQ